MTPRQNRKIRDRILAGVEAAVASALEKHKKLGEPIAVWKGGKVVVLQPQQIPVRSRTPRR
jgi:hypothetical protein